MHFQFIGRSVLATAATLTVLALGILAMMVAIVVMWLMGAAWIIALLRERKSEAVRAGRQSGKECPEQESNLRPSA